MKLAAIDEKHRKKRGEITVFACGMMAVLLILIVTVLVIVRAREEKAKCVQSLSGAVESIKGDYQPALYRRYHIFALDRTYGGREGEMETRLRSYLDYNLNPGSSLYEYAVEDVVISEEKYLVEDHFVGLAGQIAEYEKIKLPVTALEEMEKQMGQVAPKEEGEDMEGLLRSAESDDTLSEEAAGLLSQGDAELVPAGEEGGESLGDVADVAELSEITEENHGIYRDVIGFFLGYDPGDMSAGETALFLGKGFLQLTLPAYNVFFGFRDHCLAGVLCGEDIEASKTYFPTEHLPSFQHGREEDEEEAYSFSIQSLRDLEQVNPASMFDVSSYFRDKLELGEEELYAYAYALDAFQYAGRELPEEHVLAYETEYLIAGERSDWENLGEVTSKIVMIRMIPNGIYAFRNEKMKTECEVVAAILLAPTGAGEAAVEEVSYVLLGIWTYWESVMDVSALVKGESVPVVKNEENWNLSLAGLGRMMRGEATQEGKTSEGETEEKMKDISLDYRAYLLFLLATMPNRETKYERMLDVMQLNLEAEDEEFRIENCIYAFEVDARIKEGDDTRYFHDGGSYLPMTE